MPTLSVVVPVYNVEKYLHDCLDSILNQSFKDIEIIIVNDFTPDNSEDIVLRYKEKDPRIVYIKHDKNLGLGAARNTGIKHAKGKWIAFVDSDDFIELDCFENMLALIEKYKADGGIFSFVTFDDDKKIKPNQISGFKKFNNPTKFNENFYKMINCGSSWNKIYKREDLLYNEIWFPENLNHEDEEFLFKYIAKLEPILVGDTKKYYHYRIRSDSIMSNFSRTRKDLPEILLNIYNFLKKEKLLEKYRRTFLIALNEFCNYYTSIEKKYQLAFSQEIKKLIDELELTEDELMKLSPIIYSFYISNPAIQKCFISRKMHFAESLLNDNWYLFGQLSRKQKSLFLIKYFSKHFSRGLQKKA